MESRAPHKPCVRLGRGCLRLCVVVFGWCVVNINSHAARRHSNVNPNTMIFQREALLHAPFETLLQTTTAAPLAKPTQGPSPAPSPAPRVLRQPRHATKSGARPLGKSRVGHGPSRLCGGRTGITRWKQAPGDLTPDQSPGLYLDVNTDYCRFSRAPQYAANVMAGQRGTVEQVPGCHFLSAVTAKGFRLFLMHASLKGTALLHASAELNWQVSWVGDEGRNAGQTVGGSSGWRREKSKVAGLVIDVDTSAAGYDPNAGPPRYFTTLFGVDNSMHIYRTAGAHIVYDATPTSFRIYLATRRAVTPKFAEQFRWTIGWIGVQQGMHASTRVHEASGSGTTLVTVASGESAPGKWRTASDGKGLFANVSTSTLGFRGSCYGGAPCVGIGAPAFVTSIDAGSHMHWRVTGAASIFRATTNGFALYLDKSYGQTHPLFSKIANLYKWRVNFIGYDGPWLAQCFVTTWSAWTPCTRSCGGTGGTQLRHRSVRQSPRGAAAPCPALLQTRTCNKFSCPVDCGVGDWGTWQPPCFGHVLGGVCTHGVQQRSRSVHRHPAHAGHACPALTGHRKCPATPCVGTGASRLCGGTAGRKRVGYGASTWGYFGPHSIVMTVRTAACGFDDQRGASPQYVVTPLHLQRYVFFRGAITGAASVLRATNSSFDIVLDASAAAPPLSSAKLLRAASEFDWEVAWAAEVGRNSGLTTAAHSGWKTAGKKASDVIALDVDTRGSGFHLSSPPQYFACLRGTKSFLAQGASVIHEPTTTGFRVFVSTTSPGLLPLTPKRAEQLKWVVSWFGIEADNSMAKFSGTSASGSWRRKELQSASQEQLGAYMLFSDVSTRAQHFEVAPNYVTALVVRRGGGGAGSGSGVGLDSADAITAKGVATLDATSTAGFKFYLALPHALAPGAAQSPLSRWRVSFLGFGRVDCKISQWTLWSQCSKTCGGGTQFKIRKVLHKEQMGGVPCPKGLAFRKQRMCGTKQCIGQGTSALCGGRSSAGHSLWLMDFKAFGHDALYIDVDTTACKFHSTPVYAVSLVGEAKHWQLTGGNAVVAPTTTSFRVVVTHPILRNTQLVRAARAYKWHINWVGGTGRNVGFTPLGLTHWRKEAPSSASAKSGAKHSRSLSDCRGDVAPSTTFFTDVDTSACRFGKTMKKAPRYFPSLLGARGHWRLRGAHVVYAPDIWGFRTYVVYHSRSAGIGGSTGGSSPTLASIDTTYKWAIGWIGTRDRNSGETGPGGWVDDSTGFVHAAAAENLGLRLRVDASASHFLSTPAFVVSVTARRGFNGLGRHLAGAANVYAPSATGFTMLLDRAGCAGTDAAQRATNDTWVANYIAYEGGLCAVTPWSSWSECDCAALYRGASTREIISERYRHKLTTSMRCSTPVLHEHRACKCHLTRAPTAIPTPVPTPTPTPKPIELRFALLIRVESEQSFNLRKRHSLRSAIAHALHVAQSQVLLVRIAHHQTASARATASAIAAAAAAAPKPVLALPVAQQLGIRVDIVVLPPLGKSRIASLRSGLANLRSGTFLVALAAQLNDQGLIIPLDKIAVHHVRAPRYVSADRARVRSEAHQYDSSIAAASASRGAFSPAEVGVLAAVVLAFGAQLCRCWQQRAVHVRTAQTDADDHEAQGVALGTSGQTEKQRVLAEGTDVPSYRAGGMVLQQAPNDDVYAFGLSDGDGHMLQ